MFFYPGIIKDWKLQVWIKLNKQNFHNDKWILLYTCIYTNITKQYMLCASLNCLSMKIVRINLVLKEELEKDGPKRHGDSQSKSTPTLSNYIPFILYT